MSFILNALRKSEQERQALQPETVTDRILLPQPQQHRSKTAKFFAVLIIANVLVIACIVWYTRNNSTPTPDTTAPATSRPLPAQETKTEPKAIAKSTQPEKAESETASIAEWVNAQKPEPAPLPVKPVIAKKPAADTMKQPATANKSGLSIQTAPAIAAAVKDRPELPETKPAEQIPVKKDIPFLSDLPFEFRQTVPKFTINVFVYSPQSEESFVMIDMVKYKPGQQIKAAMLLKEILSDSLIVAYQNQTFKIKRP